MDFPKNILLVDDDSILARHEKHQLERYGYRVVTVSSGEQAIDMMAQSEQFDLILLDLDLGQNMDGTEAAAQILKNHRLPIVFLSSHIEKEIVEKTENITSYGYVVKSTDITVLDASIKMAFKLFNANENYRQELRERQRIEAELRASEEKFRLIFENSVDAIGLSKQGIHTFVNPAYAKLFGYSHHEEIIGKHILDFIAPEEHRKIKRNIRSRNAGETIPNYYETFGQRKDGSTFAMDVHASMCQLANEWHTLVILRDISARKKAEQAVRVSEEKYRALFDQSLLGIFLHDLEGRLVDVNAAACRQTGYSRDELLQLNTFDLLPERPEMNLPRAEIIRLWRQWQPGDRFTYQGGHQRKDGVCYPIEVSTGPIRIAERQLILAIVADITDRLKVEEELRESNEKFSALFSAMTEWVVLHELVFDEHGAPINYRITDCNEAYTRASGISKEMAVGRLGSEVYQQPEPPYFEEFSKVALTGETFLLETYYAPMEKYFSISVVSPGKNKFATITSDVTDLKRSQKAIAAKNKELEQMVYVASHDLRSPLVNVEGYSRELEYGLQAIKEVLEHNFEPERLRNTVNDEMPDILDALNRIRTSAQQMDGLIKGLLKLSRSGRTALIIETLDMTELIRQVKVNFDYQIKNSDATITITALPPCRGDAFQITQVFTNLLDNALKYLDPARPGRVVISGRAEFNNSIYCIEDNGIGIAENHLEKIFELFHRLHPEEFAGEGLGLTIVRQILGRLDGEIRVESDFGKGSRFYVILPAAV